MLTITDGKAEFKLDYSDSIDLELKLNVSAYGRKWIHIGDMLYAYGTKTKGKDWEFEIDKEEFKFLLRLLEKATWEDCKGMA